MKLSHPMSESLGTRGCRIRDRADVENWPSARAMVDEKHLWLHYQNSEFRVQRQTENMSYLQQGEFINSIN